MFRHQRYNHEFGAIRHVVPETKESVRGLVRHTAGLVAAEGVTAALLPVFARPEGGIFISQLRGIVTSRLSETTPIPGRQAFSDLPPEYIEARCRLEIPSLDQPLAVAIGPLCAFEHEEGNYIPDISYIGFRFISREVQAERNYLYKFLGKLANLPPSPHAPKTGSSALLFAEVNAAPDDPDLENAIKRVNGILRFGDPSQPMVTIGLEPLQFTHLYPDGEGR